MDNNIKKLPDAYYKRQDGNNYKLLQLNNLLANELLNDIQEVNSCRDIDNAFGATLDLFGKTYGKSRGDLTDEQYRVVIKNAIAENLCQGDFNSIIDLLAQMFGCSQSDIYINEIGNNKVEVKVPLVAGFTVSKTIEMINRLLPITVYIENADLDGTFELGSIDYFSYSDLSNYEYTELEQFTYLMLDSYPCKFDTKAGFANISQTIGGYLGYIRKGG